MPVIGVQDRDDPRLSDFTGLTDVAARQRREPADGIFIAEGEKVIARTVAAGYRVRCVLTEQRWLPGLRNCLGNSDIDVYVADETLLRSITGYRVHRGALASVARRPLPAVPDLVTGARRLVVLEDLVDHTNVGAVFRSAAALGTDAVVISPQCADPLYRRSIKVSMGASLTLPWTRSTAWPADLDLLRQSGMELLALTPDAAAEPLDAVARELSAMPLALLVGTEGDGLTSATLARCTRRVRIPMAGGIDSLNAAAAAAVACWELRPAATGPASTRRAPGV
ncbi:MAG: RNA methyltransferase [Actinomycetota bacterium]|nr:MAG: RNA methyltransferase [Actinomycetota bacterium]